MDSSKAAMMCKNAVNAVTLFVKQHQSEILTATSAISTIGAVVASAKNTRSYDKNIKDEGEAVQTKMDKAIVFAKSYWPTLILTATAITCSSMSTVLDRRKQASMLLALNALEKKFSDYKQVLYDTNPDAYYAQEEEWKKHVYNQYHVCPSPEEDLYYDEISGTYFTSTHERVIDAMYNVNRMLIQNGWITLYNYYEILGILDNLDASEIKMSHYKGWSSINEFESGMHEIQWLEYFINESVIDNVPQSSIRILYPPEYLDEGRLELELKGTCCGY